MALVDLWNNDRQQILQKRIDQLISFAGEGKLRDGNSTSSEFRQLLSVVPSDVVGQWIAQCLGDRLTDFGLVLQDIVNEIGRRLNFNVAFGTYRPVANESFDGLWTTGDGIALLVESKSSTGFSIQLARIADYRKQVAPRLSLEPDNISILLVVGDDETADLESQVRGSKYAWNVRLIGVHALFRLLRLKEALDDEHVERQIRGLLVPQEFTRLDRIIELVFATAEDVKSDEDEEPEPTVTEPSKGTPPATFNNLIVPALERKFETPLVKASRVLWTAPDDSVLVSCQVSKFYDRQAMNYWFGLKRSTRDRLAAHKNSYCVFGLGTPDKVVVIPFGVVQSYLSTLFTSPDEAGGVLHWHIRFRENHRGIQFLADRDQTEIDAERYRLK